MLQDSADEHGVLGGEDPKEQREGQAGAEEACGDGWHCITVWECELKGQQREQTLDSIAFTLNHIYLHDRQIHKPYEAEEPEYLMAAED